MSDKAVKAKSQRDGWLFEGANEAYFSAL